MGSTVPLEVTIIPAITNVWYGSPLGRFYGATASRGSCRFVACLAYTSQQRGVVRLPRPLGYLTLCK